MHKMLLFFASSLGLTTAIFASHPGQAATPTLTTLVSFYGGNGAGPSGGLIADTQGNLLGATALGGANSMGTVFEILKTRNGYDTSPTVLVDFDGKNGSEPSAALVADAKGNLFGTTVFGGTGNAGTAFEIAKTKGGYASTPTILFSFDGVHGANPSSSLIADAQGNLFGTTDAGGANGMGTVFEIVKTRGGYASTPTILFSFDGAHGAHPLAGLIADDKDNLFGATYFGGASTNCDNGCGTVFEIAKTKSGYADTPTILVSFNGTNGENPAATPSFDSNGNLFGTTIRGAGNQACPFPDGCGTVFEIAKTNGGYASTPITLVSFNFSNGSFPGTSLTIDARDNLFGTTLDGGAGGVGTIFELVKTGSSYASTPTTLVSFNSFNGAGPSGGLLADASGDLFSTAGSGGAVGKGIVFELTGSGFVPLAFAGSPGSSDCYGRSVLSLQQQDQNLDAAAAARGLDRAEVLQTAIIKYCAPSVQ
ncbi:MAG: choice-of-anchor tandem repeat GloVer-containing protein [Stellaceae bacterium]